jgi:hypothetical protein
LFSIKIDHKVRIIEMSPFSTAKVTSSISPKDSMFEELNGQFSWSLCISKQCRWGSKIRKDMEVGIKSKEYKCSARFGCGPF